MSPSLNATLNTALTHALEHLTPTDAIRDTRSVAATATLADLRAHIDLPLNDAPLDPTTVVEDLVRAVDGGILDSAGPRFFGWVIGGSLPSALAADWLTSAWDQNAGLYACSPAAAVVEETVGRWLKQIFGLPSTASFALVTGCQMAHTTGLAAARHAVLERAGWDVEQRGLAGSPAIRILTSTEKHGTLNRSVRLLGLGESNILNLPTDDHGRLIPEALEAALASNPSAPTIVALNAGDVNIGAFDDFETLIPIAHRHNAWVHIDGAMGLWAAASPRHAHLLRGFEHADSWTTDGHKWLNVPYDCGFAFVADRPSHRAALAYRAAYLTHDEDARDQMDWTPEFSRRARGFPTYAALRELGRTGIADLVSRCCDLAKSLATRIGALPGAELLWEPQINQGLVRFPDPTGNQHDANTDRVIAAINATGIAFFTPTTWRNMRAMRISVSNWQTTPADIDKVVATVASILQA